MPKTDGGSQGRAVSGASAAADVPLRQDDATSRPRGRPLTDRRDQILKIAAKRFAAFGYEATSLRQIADDAKILSGSVYHHFETKDDILDEIVRGPILSICDSTLRIASSRHDAEIKLVSLILLEIMEYSKNKDAHSLLYNERRWFRKQNDFAYVVDSKQKMYDAWMSVLGEGINTGLFRADIDKFMLISTSIRVTNTSSDWFWRDKFYDHSNLKAYDLDDVIEFNLDLILRHVRRNARVFEPILRREAEAVVQDCLSTLSSGGLPPMTLRRRRA